MVLKWIKCVKTITGKFREGEFYRVLRNPYPGKIILVNESKSLVGYNIKDYHFREHFKLCISQKRGTLWEEAQRQS